MMPSVAFRAVPDRTSPLARLHPASKLAALLLALLTCFAVPAWSLPLLLLSLAVALGSCGFHWGAAGAVLRGWLPVLALVLLVHTLTTVEAAPLGTPSLQGFWRGLDAVARVVAMVGWLLLFLRITPLDEMTAGLGWWFRPWPGSRRATTRLSLALAVAVGTAPGVLAEGRRLESATRLRRAGDGRRAGWLRRRWRRLLDMGYLVVPLMESLFRRVEPLSLSLQGRLPQPALGRHLPVWQLIGLGLWAGGLAVLIWP
jgi:energy-coupling factor transporter transmembrane protein EcfT